MTRTPSARLVAHLLKHSVKTGDFVLKSGRRSSWFIDAKQTACRPEGMIAIADAALEVMPPEANAIGGLTMGADPVAFSIAAVAATRGRALKSFSIRKQAKEHGVSGRVAGALGDGDAAVVVEDTATRGTSVLDAALAVRSEGAEPLMLLAVVDRGGTASAVAAEHGLAFRALVTAPELGFPYEGGRLPHHEGQFARQEGRSPHQEGCSPRQTSPLPHQGR